LFSCYYFVKRINAKVKKLITIKEMADIVGVSPTTVSNVIHGKTKEVSKETIEKIKRVIEEYNYVPNMSARALAQNSSKIIGVIIKYPSLENRHAVQEPFFGEISGELEMDIRKAGYFMMLYCPEDVEGILNFATKWNVDGLIMLGIHPNDGERILKLVRKPVVFIDAYLKEAGEDFVNVGLEDEEGAYQVTKYLIEQGHRRIGFVGNDGIGVDRKRFEGYSRALAEYGISCSEKDLFLVGLPEERLDDYIKKIVLREYDYTALFLTSDYYAATAVNFLNAYGMRVPEDISVAGFDDNLLAVNMRPKLTTVAQNPSLKGRIAVEQLIRLINGERPKQKNIRLPIRLVIRDSVRKI